MSRLPDGWKNLHLSDIAKLTSGGTPSRKNPEYWDGSIPWITTSSVNFNIIRIADEFITELGLAASAAKVFPKDTILMAMYGQGETRGRVAILGFEAATNQACAAITVADDHDCLYVYYVLANQYLHIRELSHGGSQKNLNLSLVGGISIPVPPLAEQRKISQILSTWDEAIALVEALIAALKRRKQGLMQRLLTGEVRFPGFEDEWKTISFDKLFYNLSSKPYQTPKTTYLTSGVYPIVDQGQEFIVGYADDGKPFDNVPVIVFGDHTRILKWVDFPFIVGADGTKLLKSHDVCTLKFGYYLLEFLELPSLGYSRHFKLLREQLFEVPSNLVEQRAIADLLESFDQVVKSVGLYLNRLREQKRGLMQRLLTGEVRVRAE